ncbi:SDR family NAD(P)-dependent oxidoreductase [Azospirillum cavernae]|uniref:SDR family NAD(P)-dependent oxidoreductase n=1 Tax=Azospirillum cavernae TaxID=2320860 RepID=A0A418VQB3_9PROT|nr:SDR family NAD(P)-dependent oxidoreductase [Azospirillum cavernae]RJF78411.1 SDR family NAD(P)-dependent oxidoreductase [Azospirillum cavernae]
MQDFTDKVAVVTGAAEGIGKAIARAAAAEGMKLVLADIDAAALDALAAEFAAADVPVLALRTDVSSPEQVDALADAAFARFGAVHLLVNNAGVAVAKSVWETTPKDWEWVLGVNLYGVTNGLRAFVPRMLERGEAGHIVNTASVAGLLSVPALAAYNASKFAVVTVSEGLHHDLALRQAPIGVSVLCPSWVKTRIAESGRHRLGEEGAVQAGTSVQSQKIGQAVFQAVQAGITPDSVAESVFEAVRAGRFYIVTHPESRAGVRVRMEDILENRNPTLMSL